MDQEDNFPISDISLPEPSVLTATNNNMVPSQFTSLLRAAQEKRREADVKWDALVSMLVDEFSKQASIITKLKMEGQLNTPVAAQLLESIPEGLGNAVGGDKSAAGHARQELKELMSLENQISPVQKRIRDKNTANIKAGSNLNESNQTTSQLMTPNDDLSRKEESNVGSHQQSNSENIKFKSESSVPASSVISRSNEQSRSGDDNSGEDSDDGESQVLSSSDASTEFEQVERVNDDTESDSQPLTEDKSEEQSCTETSFARESLCSSKLDKVVAPSPLLDNKKQSNTTGQQPADLTHSNEENKNIRREQQSSAERARANQDKGQSGGDGHHEDNAKQQNLQMRRHKRQISLSEQPVENQKDLEPEVSITPNNRNAPSQHATGNLFVTDAKPQREPPLTSKQKNSSLRQQVAPESSGSQMKSFPIRNNLVLDQSEKSGQASSFRIQVQATTTNSQRQSSCGASSEQIEAIITSGLKKAPKPFNMQSQHHAATMFKQQPMQEDNAMGSSDRIKPEMQRSQVNPFHQPLMGGLSNNCGAGFSSFAWPNTARLDHRRTTLQPTYNNSKSGGQFSSNNSDAHLGGGLVRSGTIQLSARNLDAKSNQDEFNQKEAGNLALTTNVSLTESKLIIALKKKLVEAKVLLEKEHAVKMRLIEGARDLKRQLVQALKKQKKAEQSANLLSFKPRNGAGGSITDSDSESQANNQALNVQATTGVPLEEVESPLINIRMKVSSATQTEDLPLFEESKGGIQPRRVLIDADSGGSSIKLTATAQVNTATEQTGGEPHATAASQQQLQHHQAQLTHKFDAEAQTEQEYPMEFSHYDHQKVEMEMQKLMENHEIESTRLRGNVDFWKGKVDALIKSQKEMLEGKTKLHVQLEQSDLQLQDAQAQVKQLQEKLDVLQRQQLTRQKGNYNIAAAGASVDSYMSSKDLSLIEDSQQFAGQQHQQYNQSSPPQHQKTIGKGSAGATTSVRTAMGAAGGLLRAMTASQQAPSGTSTAAFKQNVNNASQSSKSPPPQLFKSVTKQMQQHQAQMQMSKNSDIVSIQEQNIEDVGMYVNSTSLVSRQQARQQNLMMANGNVAAKTTASAANPTPNTKFEHQSTSPAKQAARRAVIKKQTSNVVATSQALQTGAQQQKLSLDRLTTNAARFSSPEPLAVAAHTAHTTTNGNQQHQSQHFLSKLPGTYQRMSGATPGSAKRQSGETSGTLMKPPLQQQQQQQQTHSSQPGGRNSSEKKKQQQNHSRVKTGQGIQSTSETAQLPLYNKLTAARAKKEHTLGNQAGVGNKSSHNFASANSRPLLTTQDKFSMFTQKHVKQQQNANAVSNSAKQKQDQQQTTDQKAQRDMMVQLIRDRLLQKTTPSAHSQQNTTANNNGSQNSMGSNHADGPGGNASGTRTHSSNSLLQLNHSRSNNVNATATATTNRSMKQIRVSGTTPSDGNRRQSTSFQHAQVGLVDHHPQLDEQDDMDVLEDNGCDDGNNEDEDVLVQSRMLEELKNNVTQEIDLEEDSSFFQQLNQNITARQKQINLTIPASESSRRRISNNSNSNSATQQLQQQQRRPSSSAAIAYNTTSNHQVQQQSMSQQLHRNKRQSTTAHQNHNQNQQKQILMTSGASTGATESNCVGVTPTAADQPAAQQQTHQQSNAMITTNLSYTNNTSLERTQELMMKKTQQQTSASSSMMQHRSNNLGTASANVSSSSAAVNSGRLKKRNSILGPATCTGNNAVALGLPVTGANRAISGGHAQQSSSARSKFITTTTSNAPNTTQQQPGGALGPGGNQTTSSTQAIPGRILSVNSHQTQQVQQNNLMQQNSSALIQQQPYKQNNNNSNTGLSNNYNSTSGQQQFQSRIKAPSRNVLSANTSTNNGKKQQTSAAMAMGQRRSSEMSSGTSPSEQQPQKTKAQQQPLEPSESDSMLNRYL